MAFFVRGHRCPHTPPPQSTGAPLENLPNGWLGSFEREYSPSFTDEVLSKNNEPFVCNMSYTKVISYDYFVILQCETVSQCRSLYDYQTHKLLRPNNWLGSFERKHSLLLCGEIFLKNNEPFLRKMHNNSFMLSGFCWWYMIAQICLLISMFPATPEAQSAAARWLTSFIWKGIFSFIRWQSIRLK